MRIKQIIKDLLPKSIIKARNQRLEFKANLKWISDIWANGKNKDYQYDLIYVDKCLNKYEKCINSQQGEDGIIQKIFEEIGTTNKVTLEFGFGAAESNSHNLFINQGWTANFIDGSTNEIKLMKALLKKFKLEDKVNLQQDFITLDNLENLIKKFNLPNEIDMFSIDVDGNDYWLWESVTYLNPRVVVIEVNTSFGSDKALTIPYKKDFFRGDYDSEGFYFGASAKALIKLAEKKGMSFVAMDTRGVNCFFVRNDLLNEEIRKISLEDNFFKNIGRIERGFTEEQQFRIVSKFDLLEFK
jgi:hypothetical protein